MKVGDRVRIIGDKYNNKTFIGKTGEIVGVFTHSKRYDYVVQFEDDTSIDLHDGNSIEEAFNFDTTKHNKRWFAKEHLELVTDPLTVGLTNVIDGFTARALWADDIVCAKTTYDLRDALSKKEENYMELLNIYHDRKIAKISKDYDVKKDKVLNTDANYKIWKECFDKLAPLFDNQHTMPLSTCDIRKPSTTEETDKQIKELSMQANNARIELNNLIDEVEAQLKLCQNRDDQMEVLRLYKIIKEDGKINA